MNYHLKDVANTVHPSSAGGGNTSMYVMEEPFVVAVRGRKYERTATVADSDGQQVSERSPGGRNLPLGGVSPTVMNNHGETLSVAEPQILSLVRTEEGKRLRKEYEQHKIKRQRKYMQQLEPRTDGVTNTVTSVQKDNYLVEDAKKFPYRIRRLTPRECFRLMDVDEANIDKIQNYTYTTTLKSGEVKENKIGESAQYKLAGNSIVVNCMFHIFQSLFVEPTTPQDGKPRQLDLFDIL